MADLRCFRVNPADNVATMLEDAEQGATLTLRLQESVQVLEPIKLGHKVAVTDIDMDQPVVKFGVAIGRATVPIKAGQWVHLHNCASYLDERSQTLDLHSGAATDTVYE